MTRDQYIDIARRAGFEVDEDGRLVVYGCSPALMRPNYEATIVDGMKKMVDIAIKMKCDEMADQIEKMPFGDTAASFATWVRSQA